MSFLQYLQPLFFIFLLHVLCPGRETQGTTFYFDDVDFSPFVMIFFQLMAPWFMIIPSTILSMASSALSASGSTIRYALLQDHLRHARKHGRWRHRKFYPSCFMLLSSVALSPMQSIAALSWAPGRAVRAVTSPLRSPRSSSIDPMTDFLDPEFLFTRSVDPACTPQAFFHPDVFDYLPFNDTS